MNENHKWPITLLCADWRDPLNVGSVFRLADAAGLKGIVLAGSTPAPPHPKIDKTARSTVRHVQHRVVDSAGAYLSQMKSEGYRILALEITDSSRSLFDYRPSVDEKYVLVAGNESSGVAPDLLAECEASVHLPMFGRNTSMNVSVALGAAVYLLLMQFE